MQFKRYNHVNLFTVIVISKCVCVCVGGGGGAGEAESCLENASKKIKGLK